MTNFVHPMDHVVWTLPIRLMATRVHVKLVTLEMTVKMVSILFISEYQQDLIIIININVNDIKIMDHKQYLF